MKQSMIISIILLLWFPSLNAKGTPTRLAFPKCQAYLEAPADSSNYKIKVVKSDMPFSQVRFTIVDHQNHPLAAMVTLAYKNDKVISSVYGNDDGKIFIMIYDDIVDTMIVGIVGYGKVYIPVKEIKNKVTDIKVQLYGSTYID